jgi:hypothetical protein
LSKVTRSSSGAHLVFNDGTVSCNKFGALPQNAATSRQILVCFTLSANRSGRTEHLGIKTSDAKTLALMARTTR